MISVTRPVKPDSGNWKQARFVVYYVPGTEFLSGEQPDKNGQTSVQRVAATLQEKLRALFEPRHDAAPQTSSLVVVEPCAWRNRPGGGPNLEEERIKAAQDLADRIRRDIGPERRFALVGHSHGGTVAMEAIRLLAACEDDQLTRLTGVFTAGTPIISLARRRLDEAAFGNFIAPVSPTWRQLLRSVAVIGLLFLIAAAGHAIVAQTVRTSFIVGALGFIILALAGLKWLTLAYNKSSRRDRRADEQLEQDTRFHHVVWEGDEIVNLLIALYKLFPNREYFNGRHLVAGLAGVRPEMRAWLSRLMKLRDVAGNLLLLLGLALMRSPLFIFVVGAAAVFAWTIGYNPITVFSGLISGWEEFVGTLALVAAPIGAWYVVSRNPISNTIAAMADWAFLRFVFGLHRNQGNFVGVESGTADKRIRDRLPEDVTRFLRLEVAISHMAGSRNMSKIIEALPDHIRRGDYQGLRKLLETEFEAAWPGHGAYFKSQLSICYFAKLIGESFNDHLRLSDNFDEAIACAAKADLQRYQEQLHGLETFIAPEMWRSGPFARWADAKRGVDGAGGNQTGMQAA